MDDQYLLEQKYSNMLQDVLTQKQVVCEFVTISISQNLEVVVYKQRLYMKK